MKDIDIDALRKQLCMQRVLAPPSCTFDSDTRFTIAAAVAVAERLQLSLAAQKDELPKLCERVRG